MWLKITALSAHTEKERESVREIRGTKMEISRVFLLSRGEKKKESKLKQQNKKKMEVPVYESCTDEPSINKTRRC
jgi:uncharacterized protein (DUF1015 family)